MMLFGDLQIFVEKSLALSEWQLVFSCHASTLNALHLSLCAIKR